MNSNRPLGASYRDPAGFVFQRDGRLYRQVNVVGREDYDLLMQSGLHAALVADRLLVDHTETDEAPGQSTLAYKVIQPKRVPFVSYPYEWSFSQLRDAALLTLRIQQQSLKYGMSLKDASAFNVQFQGSSPMLIDTLSFERYDERSPWVAYRQFCQHFLAPLAVMSTVDVRLGRLLRCHLDGLPLDLACNLLPFRSRFRFSWLMHLFLHARSQRRHGSVEGKSSQAKFSRHSMLALIDSLQGAIDALRWRPYCSEWSDYYADNSYAPDAFDHKEQLVAGYLDRIRPSVVWDLGANTGNFSRLASKRGITTLAFDLDPACVDANYRESVERKDPHLLPLWIDLTNPSPNLGWRNDERLSLTSRGPADLVLALGLIHHLAIAANLPFPLIAEFCADVGRNLVIEFVPRGDSQVQRMLSSRNDIFSEYHRESFEHSFKDFFEIVERQALRASDRTLYLMRRRERP